MPPASANPEAVILAATLGAIGVIVVGLLQGVFLFLNSTTQRRHERRQAAREARSDRLKTQADAVDTCIDAAVKFRTAADAYDQSKPETALAFVKAETKLEAASQRISHAAARKKVQDWQEMTRLHVQGAQSAATLHEAWKAAIHALGSGWSEELSKSEKVFQDEEEWPPTASVRVLMGAVGSLVFSAVLTLAGHSLWHWHFLLTWVVSILPLIAFAVYFYFRHWRPKS